LDVSSKKLENTVKIGINTIKETINEDKNQIFKFFNISDYILIYDFYVSTTNPHLLWTQEKKIKN
tara:strand:- start:146 stop:340 length:195 start_codon:yes stop_codon:yes gene_type:complete